MEGWVGGWMDGWMVNAELENLFVEAVGLALERATGAHQPPGERKKARSRSQRRPRCVQHRVEIAVKDAATHLMKDDALGCCGPGEDIFFFPVLMKRHR